MSILDLLDEDRASRLKFEEKKDEALAQFQRQKDSLVAIATTQWFREIVMYWDREVKACEARLETMTKDNIKEVQGELKLAKRFLQFLENITSYNI